MEFNHPEAHVPWTTFLLVSELEDFQVIWIQFSLLKDKIIPWVLSHAVSASVSKGATFVLTVKVLVKIQCLTLKYLSSIPSSGSWLWFSLIVYSESSGDGSSVWIPTTYLGDLDSVPHSWLWTQCSPICDRHFEEWIRKWQEYFLFSPSPFLFPLPFKKNRVIITF